VSTPDQRARDKDRDAAIEIVEAAWADGQIVEADRDHRVESLLRAHTLAEVQMVVHDLQPPSSSPAPVAEPVAAPAAVPAPVPADLYGASDASAPYPTLAQVTAAAPKGARVAPLIVLVVVLAVVGAGVAGLVAAVSSVTSGGSSSGTSGSEDPARVVNVFSDRGFEELLSDIKAANESTEAFEAVLYPTYAVVYLPVDATSRRYSYWYWNGVLDDLDSKGTSTYERYDLADVDPAVVIRLVKRARGLVDEPTSWYAIVRAPEEDGAAIWAYASNEYSESEYVGATLEGKVVYDSSKN
jgi:hypothetical protein